MTTTINASPTNGLVQTADGSGVLKVQSNGVATNALAWCTFNGTTGTILASYNISTLTKLATGSYKLTFTNAMSDANYTLAGMGSQGGTYPILLVYNGGNTTTYCQAVGQGGSSSAFFDRDYFALAVFGN